MAVSSSVELNPIPPGSPALSTSGKRKRGRSQDGGGSHDQRSLSAHTQEKVQERLHETLQNLVDVLNKCVCLLAWCYLAIRLAGQGSCFDR